MAKLIFEKKLLSGMKTNFRKKKFECVFVGYADELKRKIWIFLVGINYFEMFFKELCSKKILYCYLMACYRPKSFSYIFCESSVYYITKNALVIYARSVANYKN